MSNKLPSILFKKPDADVDAALLKQLAQVSNCYGGVYLNGAVLAANSFDELPDPEEFVKQMADFNDVGVMLWFNHIENGMDAQKLQPFPLLRDKADNVLIAGCAQGNFSRYKQENSTAPAEFYLAAEFLIPKLQDMYESCGNNLDKLWAKLKLPLAEKDFAQWSDNGFISLLSCRNNGDVLTFRSSADIPLVQPWGWATSLAGLVAAAPAPVTKGLMTRIKNAVTGNTAPTAPVEAPAPKTDKEAVEEEVKEGFDYTRPEAPVIEGPPQGWTRKQKEQYYQQNAGFLPKNVQGCPKVRISPEKWKKMRADHAGTTTVNSLQDIPADKVTVVHKQPATAKADTAVVDKIKSGAPVIPPQSREKFLKMIAEAAGNPADKFPDGVDEKHSTGFEQLGIGVEAAFNWPRRTLLRLFCLEDPHSAAILWKNCIDVIRMQSIKLEEQEKQLDDLTDPNRIEEAPAEEVVETAPAAKPVTQGFTRNKMRKVG